MSALSRLFAGINDLDAAKADARAARARLLGTVEEIQTRMTPANLLDEAMAAARARSTEMVENAGRAARDRPATVAATVAGIGLLLARKPLLRLGAKLLHRGEETPDADHQFSS
ncbi:DUF3618 domain-containing protein [Sphingomonas oligoaromativorans]|jgi:ElaB/YqjD/DUF883 family membrane-anchored ribosome-binding protein|uniref:DUF3618 domain-containing protein n=1 Tax=Sphingomonas oligoaromativorans TaxID=575322 RepID=UPI0014233ABB|nr:DUF3618 domain-containing protein [Sphingomonas oligoaromativorans]NIJ32106.1 ElaB/YqjD/DUF883 family membrane-anchored ribosome-binding protein [Sphingomonas oligoaromativorans]